MKSVVIDRKEAFALTRQIWEYTKQREQQVAECGGCIRRRDRRVTPRVQRMLYCASAGLDGLTLTGNESRTELEHLVSGRVSGHIPLFISIFAPWLVRWMIGLIVDLIIRQYYNEQVFPDDAVVAGEDEATVDGGVNV